MRSYKTHLHLKHFTQYRCLVPLLACFLLLILPQIQNGIWNMSGTPKGFHRFLLFTYPLRTNRGNSMSIFPLLFKKLLTQWGSGHF